MLTEKRAARILKDMKPLSEELRAWREASHLTLAEAARRCGMSAQHYWQLENAERGVGMRTATVIKLAEGTGIPMERLIKAAELQRDPAATPVLA